MKHFLFILLAITSSSSALAIERVECSDGPASNAYVLNKKDGFYELRVSHAWSEENAPIFSGDVYVRDVPRLIKKIELAKAMGSALYGSLSGRKLRDQGPYHFHCFVKNPLVVNKAELEFLSFYIESKYVWSGELKFQEHRVGVEVGTGGQIHDMPRTYVDDGCKWTY